MNHAISLSHRTLVIISGADRIDFLQGLLTNNVNQCENGKAIYACLLTPQGKFLHDMIIASHHDKLWCEIDASSIEDFITRLKRYTLRAQVTIEQPDTPHMVLAVTDPAAVERFTLPNQQGARRYEEPYQALLLRDPRLERLGARIWLPQQHAEAFRTAHELTSAPLATYEQHRLALGVPDGRRDMTPESALLLEWRLDKLHAIDFTKGCYVGQEVTARTHHRANLRKHSYIIHGASELPDTGTGITTADGIVAGSLGTHEGRTGIAVLKDALVIEATEDAPLHAGNIPLTITSPDWA